MWVLAPSQVLSKSKDGSNQAQEPLNSPWVLTGCGNVTIGRPNQKGGTEGKADIIAKGDSSVSSIHATFKISGKTGARPVITLTGEPDRFSCTRSCLGYSYLSDLTSLAVHQVKVTTPICMPNNTAAPAHCSLLYVTMQTVIASLAPQSTLRSLPLAKPPPSRKKTRSDSATRPSSSSNGYQ